MKVMRDRESRKLKQIISEFNVETFNKKEYIFRKGEYGDYACFILDGTVQFVDHKKKTGNSAVL